MSSLGLVDAAAAFTEQVEQAELAAGAATGVEATGVVVGPAGAGPAGADRVAADPAAADTVARPARVTDPSLQAAFVASGAATLVVLALINATDYAVSAALAVLAPDVERTLHLSDAGLLTIVAITGIAFTVAAVPVGLLSDRVPRPRVTGVLTVISGVSTLLTAGVRTGAQLGATRVATGAAQSAIQSTHLPLLADTYPLASRQRVYAVHSLAPSAGTLVGPLIAGPIAALAGGSAGWRWPFVLLAAVSTALGVAAIRLPEPGRARQETADGQAQETAPLSLRPAVTRLLRIRSLVFVLLALTAIGVSLVAVPSLLSLYLERTQHQGATARGVLNAIASLGSIAGLLTGARVGERLLAERPQAFVRLLGLALCVYALLESAALHLHALAAVVVLVTVAGFFGSLGIVPLYATVTSVVPPRLRSLAFALVGLVVVVGGGAIGSVVGGVVSDDHGPAFAITLLLLVTTPVAAALVGAAGRTIAGDAQDVVRELAAAPVRQDTVGDAPALALRGVSVSYGERRVVFDLDLEVRAGEVLALLGTNGAGKSTILRAISGLTAVDRGVVLLDGEDIAQTDPAGRVRRGVVQVVGGRAVFPELSVLDNLLAGAHTFAWDRARQRAELTRVLGLFPVLADRLRQPAGLLSGGEQQMLGIAKALLLRPRVLLVDELSLGLAPAVVSQLLGVVAGLRAEGVAIVVVEQSLTTALSLADRAIFLERGRVRYDGDPAELAARGDLARAVFLGADGG